MGKVLELYPSNINHKIFYLLNQLRKQQEKKNNEKEKRRKIEKKIEEQRWIDRE